MLHHPDVGEDFQLLAVKMESIYYLPFPANSVSLTDHCLIYKRSFNIHESLEGICQLLLELLY